MSSDQHIVHYHQADSSRHLTSKALATRAKILDNALDIFCSYGFHNSKLETVVGACKIRKGNFYYYFESKDFLALSVIEERIAPAVDQRLDGLIFDANTGPLAVCESIVSVIRTDADPGSDGHALRNFLPLLRELTPLSEAHEAAVLSVLKRVEQRLSAELECRKVEAPKRMAALMIALGMGTDCMPRQAPEHWGLHALAGELLRMRGAA
jgi:AcrR family transcriptional regulator